MASINEVELLGKGVQATFYFPWWPPGWAVPMFHVLGSHSLARHGPLPAEMFRVL